MRHPRPHKNAAWTQPSRSHAGHRRADAKLARFVAGGADHSTLSWRTANDHRLPKQLWIVPLLNRGVKRIHIEMQDHAGHREEKQITPRSISAEKRADIFADSLVDLNIK